MRTLTSFKNFASVTHQGWFSGTLVVLRIAIGVQFLMSGLNKFGEWSAQAYLESSTGPFQTFFQSLAGSSIVDQLNVWGLTLIGIALILGLMVRPASFFGVVLMVLYYLAHFDQNTAHGIVDMHIVNILVFTLFLSGGAGHVFGLDGLVFRQFRNIRAWVRFLFG